METKNINYLIEFLNINIMSSSWGYSTDRTNKSRLLCYVRYQFENKMNKYILFSHGLHVIHIPTVKIYNNISEVLIPNGIRGLTEGFSTDRTTDHVGKRIAPLSTKSIKNS